MKKRVIINTQDYLVDSVVGFIRTVMIRGRTPYCNGILVSYNEKKNQHTIEMKYKKSILFINIVNEQKMNCLLMKEAPTFVLKEEDFPIGQMKPKIGNIILKMFAVDQDQYEAYQYNIRSYSNNLYNSIFNTMTTAAPPSSASPRPLTRADGFGYSAPGGIYPPLSTVMHTYSTAATIPGRITFSVDLSSENSSSTTTSTTPTANSRLRDLIDEYSTFQVVREPTSEHLEETIVRLTNMLYTTRR